MPIKGTVVVTNTDVYVVEAGMQGPTGPAGPAGPVGPAGPAGPAGQGGGVQIDDVTAASDKTFSSQHITELLNPFVLSTVSVSPSTAEMGATVAAPVLSWSTNYPPDSITVSGVGAVTLPATSLTLAGQNLTTNTTYTVTATRNGVTKNASATVAFLNRVYWGVSASQTTDPSTIVAFASQLSGARARSVTYDCSGGRFFHLAYPKRMGVATFKINNLTYSDVTMTEVVLTNTSGYSEAYYVFFCNVIQFGASITLVVQ